MKKISDTQASGTERGVLGPMGHWRKELAPKMNLNSRGARRTLAAVCSTAIVAAGASFFAAPASASGTTLSFGPTATSATITNVNPVSSLANAETAYGLKVTGATGTDPMRVSVLSGPSGGSLLAERRATNGTPQAKAVGVTASTTITATAAAAATALTVASTTGFANNDVVAILNTVAGTVEFAQVATTAGGVTINLTTALVATHTYSAPAPLSVIDLGPALSSVSTTVTGDQSGNAGPFAVGSAASFQVGDWVRVDADAPANADVRQIVAISGNNVTLNTALTNNGSAHAAADPFIRLISGGTGGPAVTGSNGSTSLTVPSGYGFAAGDQVVVMDGATKEIATVVSSTSTNVTVQEPLTLDHAVGSAIFKVLPTDVAFAPVTVGTSRKIVNFNNTDNADNVFLAATTPGTYTLQLFKDRNDNGHYDSTQDDATPVFTLNVKDIYGGGDTSDDLSPSLNVVAATDAGQLITPMVTTGLTLVDTRGNDNSSQGVLGDKLTGISEFKFTGGFAAGDGGYSAASFNGTSLYQASGVASTGTETTTFRIGGTGGLTRVGTTVISASTVGDPLAEDVTNVAGSVKDDAGTNARTVHIKPGTAAVTYTEVAKTAGHVVVPGARVYFTLASGTNSPGLTADGTLVSSTSSTKVYSATTDANGVATLVVTSDTTTNGTTYTVNAASGGQVGSQLSAAYETPAATSIDNTNTQSSLLVTPGTSATLTGRLLDQFDGAYTPSGTAPLQVAVRMPAGSGTTVGNAAFTGSNFSYTYTPSTTPVAGTSTSWDFYYNSAIDGTDSAINWTSTTSPTSVTITAPLATATPTQQKGTLSPVAGTNVTGMVQDSTNGAMPYKLVTLTGSEGVYFSTVASPTTAATDDLATTITVASNGAGVYNAYAFFAKAGSATVTVTSGTATKPVTVTVTQAADAYKVLAMDSTVGPGESSVVSGTVVNAWGFPVSGAVVNLSLGSSTVAALGAASVTTGADGIWSTTITGASSGDGDAVLTATLNTQTANAVAQTDWLDNAGLTIAAGTFQDTAKITVDPNINKTVLMAPATRVGAGKVTVYGKAKPGASVEIFAKVAYTSLPYALVGVATANSAGDWSDDEYVTTSTTFYAKTSVSSSSTVTVAVKGATPAASARVSAKVMGKGVVKLSVNGMPNRKGTITVYVNGSKAKSMASNSAGDGTVSIKTSKGRKTFKVVFSTSGCTAGTAAVVVTVK